MKQSWNVEWIVANRMIPTSCGNRLNSRDFKRFKTRFAYFGVFRFARSWKFETSIGCLNDRKLKLKLRKKTEQFFWLKNSPTPPLTICTLLADRLDPLQGPWSNLGECAGARQRAKKFRNLDDQHQNEVVKGVQKYQSEGVQFNVQRQVSKRIFRRLKTRKLQKSTPEVQVQKFSIRI